MAEETLVKEALTHEMIQIGASVIEALDRQNFAVHAAFWLYLADINRWRLLLATPEVDAKGPRKTYTRLFHAIRNADVQGITFDDLGVLDSQDPLVQGFKRVARMGHGKVPRRVSKSTIDGQYIEDALIYRTAA